MKAARLFQAMAQLGALMMIISTLCIPFFGTRAGVPEPERQLMSGAYLMDKANVDLRDEDAQHLTHLFYSFGLIEDGRLKTSHLRHWQQMTSFRDRHPHIQLILAVGGWGADGFSQAVQSADERAVFIDSILDAVQKYDLDGIDLDWEYPTIGAGGISAAPQDKENLVHLVRELRGALDVLGSQTGKAYHLSLAVGASEGTVKGIDAKALNGLVDYVNVMTYDLRAEKKATHHANLYPAAYDKNAISADSAVRMLESMGFSREKLVLGGAAYGRVWSGAEALGAAALNSGSKFVTYDTIRADYLPSNAYVLRWDEDAMAPYLLGEQTFISFDNPQSMRLKGAYARQRKLGGMMFWDYTQDSSGELLRAMAQGLRTD